MQRLLLAFVLMSLSGCSLVYSGDEYVFGDAGDAGVDSATDTGAPPDSAGDSATDALDADVPVDAGTPTRPAQTLFGSAGNRTCATFGVDGELWCWGSEHLGDGSPNGERRAVRVVGAYVGGEVGVRHVCALRTDGTMVCWGRGAEGQLGVGEIASRGVPNMIQPPSRMWTALSAGDTHTCAIAEGGGVSCTGFGPGSAWAFMGTTQLGFTELMEDPPAASTAIAIAAGSQFNCVVSSRDQQVYCWGNLMRFDGTDSNPPIPLTAAADYPDGFRSLCAGDEHICAITDADPGPAELYCWGANEQGQIGLSPVLTESSPDPWLVDGVFDSVTCGATHTCAIDTAGLIYCWGDDEVGQLGDGPMVGSDSTPTVVDFGGAHTWTQIASGGPDGRTTCAIDDAGELWCWGSNMNGQANPSTGRTVLDAPVPVFAAP